MVPKSQPPPATHSVDIPQRHDIAGYIGIGSPTPLMVSFPVLDRSESLKS
jgi:hypothetical protein